MQQRNINKDCRVFFGDTFIVPFLGPALGYLTTMYSPGWGNLVAFDWEDLPAGREFDCKFLKNVKLPPAPFPLPPARPRRLYTDGCVNEDIKHREELIKKDSVEKFWKFSNLNLSSKRLRDWSSRLIRSRIKMSKILHCQPTSSPMILIGFQMVYSWAE